MHTALWFTFFNSKGLYGLKDHETKKVYVKAYKYKLEHNHNAMSLSGNKTDFQSLRDTILLKHMNPVRNDHKRSSQSETAAKK